MKKLTYPAFALAAAASLQAQDVKLTGLIQVWATQMLDGNLRTNGNASTGSAYYNLRSEFKENTFSIRRSEIKFSGKVTDDVEFEVMVDPSIATIATNPSILQDAALVYKTPLGVEVKVGQFKNLQTLEGLTSSGELLLAERGQMTRMFGDKRDRGAAASFAFGDKAFGGKATLGVFNGMNDAVSGKGNDTNAQKDFVARLEFNLGSAQKFGAYTLQGATDLTDRSGAALTARTFSGPGAPTAAQVLDHKDKTTHLGAFYAYQDATWTVSAEVMTGLLGRRYASLINGGATASLRQHLDQTFLGTMVTGAYTTGHHTFLLRYDILDLNSGRDWTTAYNPYTESAPGVARLVNGAPVDYTPTYTELTAGWTYAFKPGRVKAANLKVNVIHRSKNFLAPMGTQTGEQGGDSLLAAFQVAF